MLVLALDTATEVATCALVADGEVLGERVGLARTVLADADALLSAAGVAPCRLDGIVAGTGPGSFTSTRMGIAAAHGLATALDAALAGVSTLDALALVAGPQALPLIDARRGEVFRPGPDGPLAQAPHEVSAAPGTVCVGDGARRHRGVLEAAGLTVPDDGDPRHVPWARAHAALARFKGVPVIPVYVRAPDADRVLRSP